MGKGGGTKMHCPHCKKTTICAAISLSLLGEHSGQRWQRNDHTDIQWFRRGRTCQDCEEDFITSEIDEKFIDELVELFNNVYPSDLTGKRKLVEISSAKKLNSGGES